ncbi:MAG: hypothetical protein HKO82_12850 [Acidimicrobiia bacterium]|nr:hypothetical protein [Acidimicrobiia bacterium]
MIDRWAWAVIAITVGLLAGTIVGWLVRNRLQAATERPLARRIGNASGAFLFWFFTLVGVVFAVGLVSPDTLRPLPRQVLDYLPRVLAAGLIVIGGWALAIIASSVLASALSRATGRLEREFELAIRYAVLSLAAVLAVAQLGVNITVVTVLVAVIALTVGASITVIIGHGSRQISGEIAAGRYLHSYVDIGDTVSTGDYAGRIVGVHPATLELEQADGSRMHVPYSKLLASGITVGREEDPGRSE